MVRHRLAFTTAGLLLFLAGIAHGEPVADESSKPPEPPSSQAWGDPETEGEQEPGWTWFGMGYERRNRERTSEPMDTSDDTEGSKVNGHSGK